ncbi:MAG: LysR substrate-binding domain-containing protein [Variovorax sp.]
MSGRRFLPKVVQEASQMQAILMLVAGGLGIALVPASMRMLRMNDVVFLDIADARSPPSYRLQFAYATSSDNPVVQSFLAVAKRTADGGRTVAPAKRK